MFNLILIMSNQAYVIVKKSCIVQHNKTLKITMVLIEIFVDDNNKIVIIIVIKN